MTKRILISGAGVAGPSLAFWLHRAGFAVTVVERALALREGGYKVDVRGAATEVLKRMGLHAAARAHDTDMRCVTYVNGAGKRIATLDADLLMGRRGDDLEVMRTDLARILYDATKHDVEYRFGDSISSLTPAGEVTFTSGTTERYDLIVGADGLHSATRRLVLGEQPLTHLGAYITIFTVPNHMGLDHEEVMYSAPGRLAFVYSTGGDTAKAGLTFAAPVLPLRGLDAGAQRQLVRDAFVGSRWQVPRLLSALDDADDFYLDSLSQVELPAWSAGRVTLVGDAAYCPAPASGQGTSLALVGGYVLARELATADGQLQPALTAYETAMRPFVAKNQAFGKKMARDMVPGGRLQIAIRNYGMRTLRLHPRKEQVIDRVLRPMLEAAQAIAI